MLWEKGAILGKKLEATGYGVLFNSGNKGASRRTTK